jgi:hypothetical protein
MTFNDCVIECCQHRELIKQFDRLTGCHVSNVLLDTRAPIVKMIDGATGYQKVLDKQAHEDIQMYIAFIFECIWLRTLPS